MSCYSSSIIGRRDSNEDKHKIIENLDGSINDKNKINFYSLFDGHGGKEVSEFLSKYLYKYFFLTNINYNNLVKLKYYIKKVYDKMDTKLYSKLKDKTYKTGSTALVSIMHKCNNETILYLINLGDCRAILCKKNNKAKQLTEDHKPNTVTEKKRISNLGGKIYYDGYDWRIVNLSVSRAFGDFDTKPYITHVPDIYKIKIKDDDQFIVLACDGLWDVMSNQDVVDFVAQNRNKKNIANLLTQEAYDKGSTDNISVIIKFF